MQDIQKDQQTKKDLKQEGFLQCQTPTSTVWLKVEGCRVKNGGSSIESEELRVWYQKFARHILLVTEGRIQNSKL